MSPGGVIKFALLHADLFWWAQCMEIFEITMVWALNLKYSDAKKKVHLLLVVQFYALRCYEHDTFLSRF